MKKNTTWQEEFKSLEKDSKYKNLVSHIKDLEEQIEALKIKNNGNEKIIKDFKKSEDQSKEYEDKKAEDFYDVIFKINSIINLSEGWDILMTEEGEKNYGTFSKQSIIRIGVIGNENKGKTTILKKLSDFNLPTGYSIKTEGLSIKYPQLKDHPNLKLALLDSAGLETPILNFQKDNNIEVEFIEKARDKLLTEVFLQNFIIQNSDLLLLVFGKLSFEEQKLLEKIKRDMKNIKRKESLFVIHNLKKFERKSQVENYIKEILLNSSTFNIESSTLINKYKNESTWEYFYEPNSNPKIFHLIFAKEGTEAGDFYNQNSINYILNKTSDITDRRSFNIINSIIDTFCLVSESILEEPLKKEEDILLQDKKIKLNSNKEKHIKLKKCLIDEIGFSNFLSNGFEPKYEYYISDDKLIISLEMPGKFEKTKYAKESKGSYTYIKISGIKMNEKEDNLKKNEQKENSFNNKEYGEFNTTIKLENISLDSEKPKISKKDGITTFIFQIKKDEEETEF